MELIKKYMKVRERICELRQIDDIKRKRRTGTGQLTARWLIDGDTDGAVLGSPVGCTEGLLDGTPDGANKTQKGRCKQGN